MDASVLSLTPPQTPGCVGMGDPMLDLTGSGVAPFVGPLDGTSPAWARSESRRLLSSWTGALIRVRRSSDNTEQDISYGTDNLLDQVALLAFCAGNGFIVKIYDQSGNGVDRFQSILSQQSQIVFSGVVNIKGLLPASFYTGGGGGSWMDTTAAVATKQIHLVAGYNGATFTFYQGLIAAGSSGGTKDLLLSDGSGGQTRWLDFNDGGNDWAGQTHTYTLNGVDNLATRDAPMTKLGAIMFSGNTGSTRQWGYGEDQGDGSRYWPGWNPEDIGYSDVNAVRAAAISANQVTAFGIT